MKYKILIFSLSAILFSGCGIPFHNSVHMSTGAEFVDECHVRIVDKSHFEYHGENPSVVFIYSDEVKHCRKQAKVINQAAQMYDGLVDFWAIHDNDAIQLLSQFGFSGKLPVYLFICSTFAYKIVPDEMNLSDLQRNIYSQFGIKPL